MITILIKALFLYLDKESLDSRLYKMPLLISSYSNLTTVNSSIQTEMPETTVNRLLDMVLYKYIFGFIMLTLCLITSIGNLSVIYRYGKRKVVNSYLNHQKATRFFSLIILFRLEIFLL